MFQNRHPPRLRVRADADDHFPFRDGGAPPAVSGDRHAASADRIYLRRFPSGMGSDGVHAYGLLFCGPGTDPEKNGCCGSRVKPARRLRRQEKSFRCETEALFLCYKARSKRGGSYDRGWLGGPDSPEAVRYEYEKALQFSLSELCPASFLKDKYIIRKICVENMDSC